MTTVKVSRKVMDRIEASAQPGESKDKTLRRMLLGEPHVPRSANRRAEVGVVKVSQELRTYVRRKALPKETVDATLLRLMGIQNCL